jgi:arylsulfatase A-like enzyme
MVNGLPLTDSEQMQLTLKWGGLEAWNTEMMYSHYSSAWAGNTPFQWGKQVGSHLGGTRNPLVVRYPTRIAERGGLRSQFTHVTDIGPTILDMVGIPQPTHVDGIEQQPMTGVTFADSLADANAAERHTQQYFENFGNRAMYSARTSSAAVLASRPEAAERRYTGRLIKAPNPSPQRRESPQVGGIRGALGASRKDGSRPVDGYG